MGYELFGVREGGIVVVVGQGEELDGKTLFPLLRLYIIIIIIIKN